MKDDDEPSDARELSDLPDWDRSLWLSRAYLEAGVCLCSSMLDGDFSSQYSSSRVILHVTRQGIELFLKGALQAAGFKVEALGHNLDSLFLAYRSQYSALSFHFEIPKVYGVNLNASLFPGETDAFHKTLDQRHRYATDRLGQSFASPEVFDPVTTQAEIDELRRVLGIIEWCELRPLITSRNAA